MVTHRNVLDYAGWSVDYLGISSDDKVLATAPFHFDMSTFDVFASLCAGARLCPVAPESYLLFPQRLLDYLEAERGPRSGRRCRRCSSTWRARGASRRGGCRRSRGCSSAARCCTRGTWRSGCASTPRRPSTTSTARPRPPGVSLFHALPRPPAEGETRVPIGVPCANTEAFALRDDGALAAPGEAGRALHHGAPGSRPATGTIPRRRARAFVDNPLAPGRGAIGSTGPATSSVRRADGAFEFLGRNDEQVKYMGYRISTADVEAALMALPGVNEAAVFLDDSERLVSPELVGVVQCAPGRATARLARELGTRLPAYMVPKRIVAVPALPRTDRGKVAVRSCAAWLRRGPSAAEGGDGRPWSGPERTSCSSGCGSSGSACPGACGTCHIHPFDVIFQTLSYRRLATQPGVWGSDDAPFVPPEIGVVRLRGPAVPPPGGPPRLLHAPREEALPAHRARRAPRAPRPRGTRGRPAAAGGPAHGLQRNGARDAARDVRRRPAVQARRERAEHGSHPADRRLRVPRGRALPSERPQAAPGGHRHRPGLRGGARAGRGHTGRLPLSGIPLVVHGGRSYPSLGEGAGASPRSRISRRSAGATPACPSASPTRGATATRSTR